MGEREITLLQIANLLLRKRRWLIVTPLAVLALTIAYALTQPHTYSAVGAFMPHSGDRSASALSGIAAQFGISVGSDGGQTPRFYAELLQSTPVLDAVADSTFDGPNGRQKLNLILNIEGDDPAVIRAATIAGLRRLTTTAVDRETGIITYSVTAGTPELSQRIAQLLLAAMNEFNANVRRNRAAAERRFIEERASLARSDLRNAENRLQYFLERNRQYQGDPRLVFEYDRLTRDLRIREQVYSTLATALEQATIESSRGTPTITVLAEPLRPAAPDPRKLVLRAVIALLGGLFLAMLGILGREFVLNPGGQIPGELEEFTMLRRQATSDIKHPLRALRNVITSRSGETLS